MINMTKNTMNKENLQNEEENPKKEEENLKR